jgi:hypothetical protein
MYTIRIPCEAGEVSDGYHTFNELYDHRFTLFLALMKSNPEISWISRRHHDNSIWEGWFICGMDLPSGSVTYHLPNKMFDLACKTGAENLPVGKKWDGHVSRDVLERVKSWIDETQ